MSDTTKMEAALFEAAMAITDPEQRRDMVEAACRDDRALRQRIEDLIAAAGDAGQFMQQPAAGVAEETVASRSWERPGTKIGRYKLLEMIGEGGFGVVYMADQIKPIQRRVALKIIKAGMDTKQVIARFEAERQALALMDHPNIAKVLDAGTTDTGRPYFVMELVRGVPVTEYCDDRNLSTHERLKIFTQICSAVQHAHQKGIIHRDIKPSNILVATNGDRPVPKVIDFGIAKATQGRLTDKTLFTQFRQFIGTPAYMSPEQALMSAVDVDTRSDIYSLGVLLYELLTGKTPLDSAELAHAGYDEICRRIRQQETPKPSKRLSSLQQDELTTLARQRQLAPSQFSSALRGDLDWVVMKAVDKDRSRRYDSCGALATDIERFLHNEPVEAGPPSALYYLRKFALRHRAAALTTLALAASLLLGAIVATAGWLQAANERNKQEATNLELQATQDMLSTKIDEAQQARAHAESDRQRIRELAYASDVNRAYQALQLNDLGRARGLVERHLPNSDDSDLRHWEWRALWRMSQSDALAMFGDGIWIFSISVSPNDRWIATGEFNGGVRVWDAEAGGLAHTLWPEAESQFGFVQFAPDGSRLYATAQQGMVKCWSVPSFQETDIQLDQGSRIRDLAVSADYLAVYDFAGNVTLWDFQSFEKRQWLAGPGGGVQEGCLAFSSDGSLLAVGAEGRGLIFDVVSGKLQVAIEQSCKYGFAFTPDGRRIASGSSISNRNVYLHRVADGDRLKELLGHSLYVHDVAMSPDGRSLASSSSDQTIRLWDPQTGSPISVLKGHSDEIFSVEFTSDGKHIVSGAKNGQIGIWNANPESHQDWPRRLKIGGGLKDFSQATFSPHLGEFLVTRNKDHTISVRSALTLNEIRARPDLSDKASGVRCSPVGPCLAVGDVDGNLIMTSLEDDAGETQAFHLISESAIYPVNYSADGQLLLVIARGEDQAHGVVWSVGRNEEVTRFSLGADIDCASLSPDGKTVVTGHTGEVLAWKVADPQPQVVLSDILLGDAIAWSPDGSTLAIGLGDGLGQLMDATTFTKKGLLRGHMMAVHGITFSPDGRRIATSGGPGEALKIWDAKTHQELMSLDAPGFYHHTVEFSPDGDAIVVIGGWGNLEMWRVPTLAEISRIQQRTGSLFPGGRQ